MKRTSKSFLYALWLGCVVSSQAKIITVTTVDNVSPGPNQTNLVQAINLLADGDTINFNIPGTGPFYLLSPPDGYPVITNIHNITIDGYSQPESSPNTNPILASNNAKIQIVLDGRNGNFRSFPDSIPGFGTDESATLFVLGSTNFSVRGVCFLGSWDAANSATAQYGVALGGDAPSDNAHISGCRFGLDLDGTTVARLKDAVAAFGSGPNNGIVVGVTPGTTNTADARAQFNIIVAEQIAVIIEGNDTRVSGNFMNVYPDGLHEFHVDGGISGGTHTIEAFIEIGAYGNNVVIGTDGDGINDAEERNIFGGVTDADDHRILEWYGGTRTNNIVAGNYIGVGVDGKTVFTNGGPTMEVIEGFNSTTTVQVGSDFDGVSDDIEANHIYWNNPFSDLYPTPSDQSALGSRWRFAKMDVGALVSVRGNVLVNNDLVPYTYAPEGLTGDASRNENFTNFSALYMDVSGSIIPTLDPTNSIFPTLKGTFAVGLPPYTNIMIDVYQLDPQGWTNGMQFLLPELTDQTTFTNGFPQGAKYLGTFSVGNTGTFSVDLTGMDLGAGAVTVTANYSADPPKTHRGRTHTSNFSMPISLIPGGTASVGLNHTVPDVAVWYSSTGNYATSGPVDVSAQLAPLDNWEPNISVLGDSTFLIGMNIFADDQTVPPGATYTGPAQRFIVAFQPAGGGQPKIGEHYFTDEGAPFRGVVNLSRENGNPQRVAGDKRHGAVNFMTASETSLGQIAGFQSDNRWKNNAIYQGANRYVTEQIFSLDTTTLVQTRLTKAWDFVYGPDVTTTDPIAGNIPQLSRTGGRPEALDNGNFVVMIDDKTGFSSTSGEVTTFSIVDPTGAVVKGPTLVDPRDIWDNMTAYKGGFAIRVHNMLYFFDDNGDLQHTNDINVSSGLAFGTGREDASRIGSDIRSYYVYLAGQTPEAGQANVPVSVAIWDSRTGNFVAQATVTDTDPTMAKTDRVSIGVDALDRFCVAYSLQPTPDFTHRQVAARVMAFDGTNITYLTHSFFPFVNYENNANNILGYETFHPSVAMTTMQICIAAKGQINSTNSPTGGPDTALQTPVYTVVTHPKPVSPVGTVQLTVTRIGNNLILSWSADAGNFTLQATGVVTTARPWPAVSPQPPIVPGPGNTLTMTVPISAGNQYFQLAR